MTVHNADITTGRYEAKRDWMKNGELGTPYPKGSDLWKGYELMAGEIEGQLHETEMMQMQGGF